MASCWIVKAEVRETIDLSHIPAKKIIWPISAEKRKHNKTPLILLISTESGLVRGDK